MSSTRSISPPAPATDGWGNQALLLVGLGSERFAEPGDLLRAHADRLRALNLFREVEAGCIAGEPVLAAVLARITAPVVHIVPYFMSNGHLVKTFLPKSLAQAAATYTGQMQLHDAVGEHRGLADLVAHRAARKARAMGIDPASLTLLLIGHGTLLNPASREATRRHAVHVAARNIFADVRIAYLDEAPEISVDLLRDLPAPTGVLCLFATQGMHGGEDVPRLIAAARSARADGTTTMLDFGIIGDEPDMADLIIGQIRCAADDGSRT